MESRLGVCSYPFRRHQLSPKISVFSPIRSGRLAYCSAPIGLTSLSFPRRHLAIHPAKSNLLQVSQRKFFRIRRSLINYSRERGGEAQRRLFRFWVKIVAVCIFSGALLLQKFWHEKASIFSREPQSPTRLGELEQAATINSFRMTENRLSGRPGNLTADQEEKLREAWIATLQVFGILDNTSKPNGNGNNRVVGWSRQKHGPASPDKAKKKIMSLFGRKRKDSDTESITSVDPTSPVASPIETDDKYGQTKQFLDTLASQSPESLRSAFWSMVKHDHPDALLLRFLRARKWDVEKALVMMVSTMSWRATEMHVDDDIISLGEEGSLVASQSSDPTRKKSGEEFLAQLRMGKSFLHGVDKSGRPMCFVRVRLHKQGEQSEESLERYTVFVIETARMLLAPPVDTAVSNGSGCYD